MPAVLAAIQRHGSLEHARRQAHAWADEAEAALAVLPDSRHARHWPSSPASPSPASPEWRWPAARPSSRPAGAGFRRARRRPGGSGPDAMATDLRHWQGDATGAGAAVATSAPTLPPLRRLPPPGRLYVPLLQHQGEPARPCVVPGQQVCAGERIGNAVGPLSAPVHAPLAGRVLAISERDTGHASGRPPSNCFLTAGAGTTCRPGRTGTAGRPPTCWHGSPRPASAWVARSSPPRPSWRRQRRAQAPRPAVGSRRRRWPP